MGLFYHLLTYYRLTLIKGSLVAFIVLIIAYWLLPQKKQITKTTFEYLKWILVVFSVLVIVYYPFSFLTGNNHIGLATLIKRMTGPYAFLYWFIFIGAISPLFLLISKLKNNLYLLFLITVWMNLDWLIDSYRIHAIMLQGNYTDGRNHWIPFRSEWMMMLNGLVFGIGLWLMAFGVHFKSQSKS